MSQVTIMKIELVTFSNKLELQPRPHAPLNNSYHIPLIELSASIVAELEQLEGIFHPSSMFLENPYEGLDLMTTPLLPRPFDNGSLP